MKTRILFFLIILLSIACSTSTKVETSAISVAINEYRQKNGLPPIQESPYLVKVAEKHVEDLQINRPDKGKCNIHSWSNKGQWTDCCYVGGDKGKECMLKKPGEISGGKFNKTGFEIAATTTGNMDFKKAIACWRQSKLHREVILNMGKWKEFKWEYIGGASSDNYAVVWFSGEDPPSKEIDVSQQTEHNDHKHQQKMPESKNLEEVDCRLADINEPSPSSQVSNPKISDGKKQDFSTKNNVIFPLVKLRSSKHYKLEGPIMSKWPVYVEVDHSRSQKAKLTVRLESDHVKLIEEQFQIFKKLELPEFGSERKVGIFDITVFDEDGQEQSFKFIGIAVGPNAVGSFKVDNIGFGERVVHIKQEQAYYRFRSLSDFHVVVDFIRKDNVKGLSIPIMHFDKGIIHGGEWIGFDFKTLWDGRDYEGNISLGKHMLGVRMAHKEGDWINRESDEIEIID